MARSIALMIPLLFLLPACDRDVASDEVIRHVMSECGLKIDNNHAESGFDYAGVIVYVKKVPQREFDRKLHCVRAIFFIRRLRADISNGSDLPAHYISIG